MTAYLIEMFGVSLALTLLIELAAAFVFGLRSWKSMLLAALVNILTNPPAVMLYWVCGLYLPDLPELPVQVVIEFAVVVTEALVYRDFAEKVPDPIRHPVVLSLTANMCSWLFGLCMVKWRLMI